MVYKKDPSYLWLKGRIYYYNRHIPRDVRHHYDVTRLVICLKTRRHDLAVKAAARLSHQLEDYWTTFRFGSKTFNVVSEQRRDAPILSEALETYLRLKGNSKGKLSLIKSVLEQLLKNSSEHIFIGVRLRGVRHLALRESSEVALMSGGSKRGERIAACITKT